jgi:hypothetical protein
MHLIRRNQSAAVVISEEDDHRLQQQASPPQSSGLSALERLLQQPLITRGRSKAEIDADLAEERAC